MFPIFPYLEKYSHYTTKFIYDNVDDKQNVIGIFLDIKKVVDSVNHDILLKKYSYVVFEVLLIT